MGDYHRLAGPMEIADTVLFICSDVSSLNGETVSFNGGHYIQ